MKKVLLLLLIAFIFHPISPTLAIEDPTKVSNNKVGMHILFPSEIQDAARLINANGGEWGYVTIPMQSGDKDLQKWQDFFNECRRLMVIPLVRLATEGDYFDTKVWRKPKEEDIVDFANFLNSLDWPTKNRYIIVFNEVNRADEWGGKVSPDEYSRLLSYAVSVFKSKSQDFFIIGGGFDNAAPNQGTLYMNQYSYMRAMDEAVPGIFAQIDGLSSHSYPNPGFSQPPSLNTPMSIASFQHERDLAKILGGKTHPIFITETGWTSDKINDARRAEYYKEAFSSVWNDAGIVAITPFILHAVGGPFAQFSFIKPDGSHTEQYKAFEALQKIKGNPMIIEKPLPTKVPTITIKPTTSQVRDFSANQQQDPTTKVSSAMRTAVKWIFRL